MADGEGTKVNMFWFSKIYKEKKLKNELGKFMIIVISE